LRLGALEEQLLLQRRDESVDVCRLLEIVRLLAAEGFSNYKIVPYHRTRAGQSV
jgi:hypothetical protein